MQEPVSAARDSFWPEETMKMDMIVYAAVKNTNLQDYVDGKTSKGYVNVIGFPTSKMSAIIPEGTNASHLLRELFQYDGNGNFKIGEVNKDQLYFLREVFQGKDPEVELVSFNDCLGNPINDGFAYNLDKGDDFDEIRFFCNCTGHCYDDSSEHCELQYD